MQGVLSFYLNILKLFNTVNKLTPVSATTASQTGAIPTIPRINTIAFIINEKTTLNFTIFIVFLEIFIDLGNVSKLFDIKIPSAVELAISDHSPIDIPKFASAKTGLSFIPSPTNIIFPFFFNSFICSCFWLGSNLA